MAQKFVGVDLGNRRVKIAVITSGFRGAQVMHVWEKSVSGTPGEGGDPTDPAIDTALKMIEERGLAGLPTGVCLPGGSGSYRVLTFPFEDPRQIAQAVTFEADGQFPLPIEELAVDHLTIKRGDGQGRALVVAAKRTTIQHVTARFELAKLNLKLVTTSALALAQALSTLPAPELPPGSTDPGEPVRLIVDIGYKSTDVVALAKTGPVGARTLRRGTRQLVRELKKAWRVDAQTAERTLAEQGNVDDPAVRRALQPLLRELEHTRQWLRAELGCQIVEIQLAGGASRLRGLGPWVGRELGLQVGPVAPAEGGALRGVQGREWGGALVALGAAVATGRRPLIQLHDAFDGGAGDGEWLQKQVPTLAALGVAILAFAFADSLVKVRAAERERDAYAAELETETADVFGTAYGSSDLVRAKLASVDGGDMRSQIPERGALEVLELLTKHTAPEGGRQAPEALPLPPGYTTGVGPDGLPAIMGPDGQPVPMGPDGQPMIPGADPTGAAPPAAEPPAGEEGEGFALAPVTDINAGVLPDDDLVVTSIEIRELKVEMNVSATRSTTQDRLAVKLERIACIDEITKGVVRDRNDRNTFEMTLDHNCYTGNTAMEGAVEEQSDEAEGAVGEAAAEEEDDNGEG